MNLDFSAIKFIVFDVDGTLTDGGIYITDSGEEFKKFHVKDGMAITRLQKKGIKFGIISGSKSQKAIYRRAENLNIQYVYVGDEPKTQILESWLAELGLAMRQVLFMGDDLSDVEIMRKVGLAACPADAADAVKQIAHVVTQRNGGEACFRELADKYLFFD